MEDSPLISRPAIEFVLNQKFKKLGWSRQLYS